MWLESILNDSLRGINLFLLTGMFTLMQFLKYFRLNWVTEITQVEFEQYFIDEQRFGPYKMWHHEHLFEPVDANNCKMTDIVSYKLPYGLLGKYFKTLTL